MTRPAVRALVVDDESHAREYLCSLLTEEDEFEVVGACASGAAAVEWLEKKNADVLFLDIQMPDLNGFEVIANVGADRLPELVFVTAFDEFALQAFSVGAWDYLLKPFDRGRLQAALRRVLARLSVGEEAARAGRVEELLASVRSGPSPPRWLALREGRSRIAVRSEAVVWAEAESNYVRLHLEERSHLARVSLTALEGMLNPDRFVRVHRSAIVNVDQVRKVTPCGHGDLLLTLVDGTEVPVSRRYRKALEGLLQTLP